MRATSQRYAAQGMSSRFMPRSPPTADGMTDMLVITACILSILLVSNEVWLMQRSII